MGWYQWYNAKAEEKNLWTQLINGLSWYVGNSQIWTTNLSGAPHQEILSWRKIPKVLFCSDVLWQKRCVWHTCSSIQNGELYLISIYWTSLVPFSWSILHFSPCCCNQKHKLNPDSTSHSNSKYYLLYALGLQWLPSSVRHFGVVSGHKRAVWNWKGDNVPLITLLLTS